VAVLIDNPDAKPAEWRTQICSIPDNRSGVVVGSGSMFEEGGYLLRLWLRRTEPARHLCEPLAARFWPFKGGLVIPNGGRESQLDGLPNLSSNCRFTAASATVEPSSPSIF
jgi:hypothetical protein